MIDVYCTGCLRPITEHSFTFGRCDDGIRHITELMDSEYVRELRVQRARALSPDRRPGQPQKAGDH